MELADTHLFDDRELCEVRIVDDDREFRDFLSSNPTGITFIPEKYKGCEGLLMKPDAGDFAKWLRQNKSDINVEMRKTDKRLVLRSGDYWLPLVFLASDVALPIYLSLVSNYIYDRMKGALIGEKARVHLEVIYEDKEESITKKFTFEGDGDGLKEAIKKFDLNKFMDK